MSISQTYLYRRAVAGYVADMEQQAGEGGWRGSAEVWLRAAYDALIESGVEAVKIQPLARRLRLSRTSFYWFFRDRDELLATLLDRWRAQNTGGIVARADAYAETVAEAMLNVFDCWLDPAVFDAQFEFAVRSWALQSDTLRAEIQDADRQRLAALGRMLTRFGADPATADVRARTIYLVQIGYISMQADEPVALRMQRIPTYVEIFTGRAPEPRELARFHARHGYTPEGGAA